MKRNLWIFVCLLIVQTAAAGELVRARMPVPGHYIVRLRDDVGAAPAAAELARAHHVQLTHVYRSVLQGFAFAGTERAAQAILRDSRVMYIEESAVVHLTSSQTQVISGNTGLDRIDQRKRPLDHAYVYNETGADSIIYIIDTGVNPMAEFSSRLLYSQSFIFGDTSTTDCADHGTSVASIAAGSIHGVAKGASIVNLKATGCGGGLEGPLAALDHVYSTHPSNKPGVVNMSWFADAYPHSEDVQSSIRTAVMRLVNRGIVVVAVVPDMPVAGNGNPYPCNVPGYEPARSGRAIGGLIAVSAVDLADAIYRPIPQTTSGTGPCVDIFAPGLNLATNAVGGEVTFPGVSSAAPLVSGVAALIQQREPSIAMTPSLVEAHMIAAAATGVLGVPADTRNALLHSLPRAVITTPVSVNAAQTFDASVPAASGGTYLWDVSNGTIVSGGSASTVTIRAGCSGTVSIYVIVDSPAGRSTAQASVTVNVPTATISGDAYVNPGGSTNIRADLTGVAPWTVYWSDGVSQTVSASPAVRSVSPANTTIYTASVTANGGCYATTSGSATITVTDCLPVSGALSVPSSAYSSATVWASATADDGAYYIWSLSNGSANWLEGPNPYLSFKMGCIGSTTVSVQITRSCGMQSTGSASIPIVQSNANVWGSTTINSGQSATIRADYTGTLPWSIRWSDGVWQYNINRTWVTRTVTPSSTTTYTAVDVRDPSNCLGTASGSATITVQ